VELRRPSGASREPPGSGPKLSANNRTVDVRRFRRSERVLFETISAGAESAGEAENEAPGYLQTRFYGGARCHIITRKAGASGC